MKKVNIGVVGAGIYGNYHIRTYSCDPHVETVVFCDLNEEPRAATQNRYQRLCRCQGNDYGREAGCYQHCDTGPLSL